MEVSNYVDDDRVPERDTEEQVWENVDAFHLRFVELRCPD